MWYDSFHLENLTKSIVPVQEYDEVTVNEEVFPETFIGDPNYCLSDIFQLYDRRGHSRLVKVLDYPQMLIDLTILLE